MPATLTIPDMSCGHCEATVTRAIRSVSPATTISVDLAAHRVTLDPAPELAPVLAALEAEGYPATAA